MKYLTALLGSFAVAMAQADAKPGMGHAKGKNGKGHSQHATHGKGPAHANNGSDKGNKDDKSHAFHRFEDKDRDEILTYFGRYRTQDTGLPPGLAMNMRRGKELPPGWQNKLVPGYRINDAEWPSYAVVPSAWFPNLRMEPSTQLYHYGDRVVRVHEPRREVIDVITLPGVR